LSSHTTGYAIAVDIGGTFTDITLADRGDGRLWQVKVPTTPADQSQAFVVGIARVLEQAGIAARDIAGVFHGTTVATNAILERKGAVVGLVTTDGCRYVLHIGRHDVPKDSHPYSWIKPERLVPPRRIREISARMRPDGTVERALDEGECERALTELGDCGVESLAVCLLHSYASAQHEQQVRALAVRALPGVSCSLSAEILPVFREYERTMATVLNAYVLPKVAGYHQRLEDRLERLGVRAPLRIMKSNGGMYSARSAASQPIHTALSGPAAAVVGAILVGQAAGYPNVISIDIGGTSADICLSQGEQPSITAAGEISQLPLNVPMVDVRTIGAGGGSIARIGPNVSLTVGPQSAGAEPGPACYGHGGTEATVTDANLVMGRSPATLGCELSLDVELARRAIEEHVASPLGLTVEDAADGIVELLNNNMGAAIRAVSVERGYDPRRFALVAGGGGGGLHAGRLAELLGIPLVIVPAAAGLLSTLGLLATDLKTDFVQTVVQSQGRYDLGKLNTVLAGLEARANAWLAEEGVQTEDAVLVRTAGLRYVHQGYELTVQFPDAIAGKALDEAGIGELQGRFHEEHERQYSWSSRTLAVELVNVGITAYGRLPKLAMQRRAGGSTAARPRLSRAVYFGRAVGAVNTPVFDFDTLAPGWKIEGPAVIEQQFSTILVLPRHRARMDDFGNVLMEVRQ
jgi:N-methylhydantoinase A